MSIKLNSPALDAGVAVAGATTDQRGEKRPVLIPDVKRPEGGDGTDIGAYELQKQPGKEPRRIRGKVRPRVIPAGETTCVVFKARRERQDKVGGPLRRVEVRFLGTTETTGRKGKVRICVRLDPGRYKARFSKQAFKGDRATVRVVPR
jgi:hypothetical protein